MSRAVKLPRWHILAARTALALRRYAAGRFPDDMSGACQVASLLLALVYAHHGIKAELVDAWIERHHCGHAWVKVRGVDVDLTATQFGFDQFVRIGKPMGRDHRRHTLDAMKRTFRSQRPRDVWHRCEPRINYPVLVPALAEVLCISAKEARARVREAIGPEVKYSRRRAYYAGAQS